MKRDLYINANKTVYQNTDILSCFIKTCLRILFHFNCRTLASFCLWWMCLSSLYHACLIGFKSGKLDGKGEPGFCVFAEHHVLDEQYVAWHCYVGILLRDAVLLEPCVAV